MVGGSLIRAVRAGDYATVKDFLKEGKSTALADNNGWTSVHHAAHLGRFEILQLLLKGSSSYAKEAVSRRTWLNETPLIVACQAKHINLNSVHLLLSLGADPNAKTLPGKTAVHFACYNPGNLAVVRLLHDMGAKMDLEDDSYTVPLYTALTTSKDIELVRFLLRFHPYSYGDFSYDARMDILAAAIVHFQDAVPDVITVTRPTISDVHFQSAICIGNDDIIYQLLQAGGNPMLLYRSGKAYTNMETFNKILSFVKPECLGSQIILAVNAFAPDDIKEKCLEALLKKFSHFRLDDKPSFTHVFLELTQKQKKLKGVSHLVMKFFPTYDFDAKKKNLQTMCRPIARARLASAMGSGWEAYCWIKNSNILPAPIRQFLLYDID